MSDNRIISGMQEWMERERNMSNLFSPDTLRTRHFQALKLDYIRELLGSTRKDLSRDEKFAARILKGELQTLEKKLFPNRMVRIALAVYRSVKAALNRTQKKSAFEKTQWMMKIDTRKKEAVKNAPTKVYQKRNPSPQLVQKKRESPHKGLKR